MYQIVGDRILSFIRFFYRLRKPYLSSPVSSRTCKRGPPHAGREASTDAISAVLSFEVVTTVSTARSPSAPASALCRAVYDATAALSPLQCAVHARITSPKIICSHQRLSAPTSLQPLLLLSFLLSPRFFPLVSSPSERRLAPAPALPSNQTYEHEFIQGWLVRASVAIARGKHRFRHFAPLPS